MNMSQIVKLIMSLLTFHTGGSKSSSTKPALSDKPVGPKSDGDHYIWKKGENISISKYFSTSEFTCQCNFLDCKDQKISKSLITKLEHVREKAKQPLIVTSAFRCGKHQAFLRASGVNTVVAQVSQHELGNAVDITPKDQKDVRGKFLEICSEEFDAIGLSDRFLHVDLRTGKKRRWKY
jgi:hypothetical protein